MLVFCDTKKQVDELERELKDRHFPVVALHGSKLQAERDRALGEFKAGTSYILVATDVASRGLDVKDIQYVINYDFPLQVEDYVHRIGRTGRAGAKGTAYSFFTKKGFTLAPELIRVLDEANQEVPPELLDFAELAKMTSSGNLFRKWRTDPSQNPPPAPNPQSAQPAQQQREDTKAGAVNPQTAQLNQASTPAEAKDGAEAQGEQPELGEKKLEKSTGVIVTTKTFDNFFKSAAKPAPTQTSNSAALAKKWGKR